MDTEDEVGAVDVFWGHGTLLINPFVAYKTYVESKGMNPISYYDFA